MKRILCFAIVCIMASVFLSVSDGLAIDINKLIGNEYYAKGTQTTYVKGNYAGSAVAEGMMVINESYVVGVFTAITDFSARVMYSQFQYYCDLQFGPYTQSADGLKLKSNTCTAVCIGQDGVTEIINYTGACDVKLSFDPSLGAKEFTVTNTITPQEGVEIVWTAKGKKMGKYPPVTP